MTKTNIDQYKVHKEPFYQAQGDEVKLYEAAYAARLPVMVKGPTGCGKSRFIEYMAWKLNKPLITVACSLLGRQIGSLEQAFVDEGGFTERLYRVRSQRRNRP